MILNKLSVINYKNIKQADLELSPKINCFFGKNGMGKTNLLDAIYYLSFCKSYTNMPDTQNVLHESDFFVIQGDYLCNNSKETIYCGFKKRQKKHFKKNQKEYDKLSDHIGYIPLIMISPTDSVLLQGNSEERRKFIDLSISQYDKEYLHALVNYQRALFQRNALLKSDMLPSNDLFELWEENMAHDATVIYRKRNLFLERFIPIFKQYYHQISGHAEEVSLNYLSHLQDETDLLSLWKQHRERDHAIGYTTKGVHKDDLEMLLDGFPIRKIGSQGQNKTFLIALKLAQFEFLKQNRNSNPLLLLDDIFDKLDADRVEKIIKLVASEQFGQIFITDTNRKYLDEILTIVPQSYRLFEVNHGEITKLERTTYKTADKQ